MRKTKLAARAGRLALAVALAVGAVASMGASAASATTVAPSVPQVASIGVRWVPTPNAEAGQCAGPPSQWTAEPDWTTPIFIDTDGRGGGCELGFGITDPGHTLTGLSITYTWSATQDADLQCSDTSRGLAQGTFRLPIGPFRSFGKSVLDDTDNRPGYCNLTFTVSGRDDIGLDVAFNPTSPNAAGQCQGSEPGGSFDTAFAGSPLTIGLDTDNTPGGCTLSLHLDRLDSATAHNAAFHAHHLARHTA